MTVASGFPEAQCNRIHRDSRRSVQRIEQHINGRLYYIELSQVQRQRWRAHVVTAQGAPTALMPFYDDTADAAAQRLAEWLSRLHRPSEAHA